MVALDQATVLSKVRAVLATATGIKAAYAWGESGANKPPGALVDFPCVLVLPGDTTLYILGQGRHEAQYMVTAQVFVASADIGDGGIIAAPLPNELIETLVGNVKRDSVPSLTSCLFESGGKAASLEYAGSVYMGFELVLRVIENAPASPAVGT